VTRKTLDMTENRRVRFMHCLPSFHDRNTKVGAEVMAEAGLDDGLEVSNDVFESPRSIVFDQAENRLHTIKAVLVATLA
ncbi:MAG TPA: ornithine carbamoyltransferase subunit F, partial [Solirubrobacterales bacterium]